MLKNLKQTGLACALALGAFAANGANYSTTLAGLNPIGYWRLNEPTQPVVPTYPMANSSAAGAALNGLYYGVPSLGQSGAFGTDTAASFSGNLQYAEVPYSAALNPSGPFTCEFWANLTNASAGAKSGVVSRYVSVTGGPAGQRGYLFFVNNGNTKWQFRVYNGTAGVTVTDVNGPDIAANTWYHIVGVYDGTQAHIYVNGVENSPPTTGVYVANTNAPLRIGAGTTEAAPTLYFPGTIDEVVVYPTVLTPDQIFSHYDAATTNAAGYAAQILSLNPSAYWHLNESPLPPYVPYAATNSGSLGSALDGVYSLAGSTSGIAGPVRGQFAGFETNNKAVDLNGLTGLVAIPPLSTLNSFNVTMTCWLKRSGSQVSFAGLMFNRSGPVSGLTFDAANRLSYTWNNAANTYNFNSGLTVPDGVWTFAAMVVTDTNAILYMGSTNGLVSATNNVAHTASDFSVGTLNLGFDQGSRYFKGQLDEAAIFDQSLDGASISNLFYSATPAIPLVTRSPADPLYEGMNVSFAAYGVGSVPVTYQWRRNGVNLSGKTSSTLVLNNVSSSVSGNYDVVVTGGSLSVTSAVSAINVVAGPPIIVTQPVPATRYEGAAATFSVTIQGSVPWSFQWKKGVNSISGATNSSYTIPSALLADAGSYNVTITNPLGSTNSAAATLTMLTTTNYATSIMRGASGPPLAYWRMNEPSGLTTFDFAGGHDGTLIGGVTNGVPGPQSPTFPGLESTNLGFDFNGTSTYVSALPPLNYTGNQATITAWVRRDGAQASTATIVCHRSGSGNTVALMVDPGGSGILYYTWADDAATYSYNSGLTLPDGTWAFVALVVDPTGATIYMDDGSGSGLQSARHNHTQGTVSFIGDIQIGRDARGDRYWNGGIDEVAFYNYPLSVADIQNVWLMAFSGPTAPGIVTDVLSQTVLVGSSASFTVGASGAVPLTYQWKHAGTNLPGATSQTLTIPSAYYTDAGSYQAFVLNSVGSTNSQIANLTVEAPSTFANLTNGLVLHLKFDGNSLDSSGHGNDGIPTDLTPGVSYVPGKIGTSGVLVGTNGYVSVIETPDLAFGPSDSFSVAFWVKCNPGNNDIPMIGNSVNSTYQPGWVFSEDSDKIEWTITTIGSGPQVIADPVPGSPVITDGVWHNIVATFDRDLNTAVTYVDGAQVDTRSIAGLGSFDTGQNITLGNDPTGGYLSATVTYQIDDVGIWRLALTPGQATGIYSAGQIGQSFDVVGPGSLTMKKSGSKLELIWQQGTLQSVDNLGDTWADVIGAVAPYHVVSPTAVKKFYRVKF